MSSQQLLFPEDLRAKLAKLYANRQDIWLYDRSDWPLSTVLGCPSEKQAIDQKPTVLSWVNAWRDYRGPAEVTWHDRTWHRIGKQELPEKAIIYSPEHVSDMLGEGIRWRRASERYSNLAKRWDNIKTEAKVLFDALADYDETDFEILQNVVQWFLDNSDSGLYPRQLPIAGVHTKWLDGKLRVVCALLVCASNRPNCTEMIEYLGLREPPVLWRMRILDPVIRQSVGGIEDVSAPTQDMRQLSIAPANVVIVENLQTFLSFQELPDTVVLLGMGFRVKEIGSIPWVTSARCLYWGDLDSAGLAILDVARSVIPNVISVLMDEQTLLAHRRLWVEEKKPHPAQALLNLTADEASLYGALKKNRWGPNVRLEQERLPWNTAWQTVVEAISAERKPLILY